MPPLKPLMLALKGKVRIYELKQKLNFVLWIAAHVWATRYYTELPERVALHARSLLLVDLVAAGGSQCIELQGEILLLRGHPSIANQHIASQNSSGGYLSDSRLSRYSFRIYAARQSRAGQGTRRLSRKRGYRWRSRLSRGGRVSCGGSTPPEAGHVAQTHPDPARARGDGARRAGRLPQGQPPAQAAGRARRHLRRRGFCRPVFQARPAGPATVAPGAGDHPAVP